MQDDKWEQLVESIQSKFTVIEHRTEDIEEEAYTVTEDILVFEGDQGRFRIVRETKPLLLDKKQHYTHRPGDTARTEYVFSETEVSQRVRVYRENNFGDWEEISSDAFV
jgi:hypothetical protein